MLKYTASIAGDLPITDRRRVKFFFQRLFLGFDDTETWSLDVAFARLMLPRIQRYRDVAGKVIVIEPEFAESMRKMELALALLSDNTIDHDEYYGEIRDGLTAFAENIRGMWW